MLFKLPDDRFGGGLACFGWRRTLGKDEKVKPKKPFVKSVQTATIQMTLKRPHIKGILLEVYV